MYIGSKIRWKVRTVFLLLLFFCFFFLFFFFFLGGGGEGRGGGGGRRGVPFFRDTAQLVNSKTKLLKKEKK